VTTSQQGPAGPHQQPDNPPPAQYSGQIPPQWIPPQPPGPPQQPWQGRPQWAPQPPAPRNGLGIAALCLGIIGMIFGLIPFTGFIAAALGAVGVILGLVGFSHARKHIATNLKTAIAGSILSVIAIALGIWGMVIVFTSFNQLAEDLDKPFSGTPPLAPPAPQPRART
jgi:hypothetical protein